MLFLSSSLSLAAKQHPGWWRYALMACPEIWIVEHLVNGVWVPKGSRTGKKEAEASVAFYNKKPGVKARAALYVPLEYVEENWMEPAPGIPTLQRRLKKR